MPMVLALLGDNPMQSEFACHIGLSGKFFCRACWVKGKDMGNNPVAEHAGHQEQHRDSDSDGHDSDNESAAGITDAGSQASGNEDSSR